MATLDTLAKPKLPPFVVTINNNYTYLIPYKSTIVNNRVVRVKENKAAGKIAGAKQTGLIIWQSEFLERYPELSAFDVYRQERFTQGQAQVSEYHLVFEPKSGANAFKTNTQALLHAGATWFLDQLLVNSPLVKALNQSFDQALNASQMLSIAYYVLLNQSLDFSNFLKFGAQTRLPTLQPLDEGAIEKLLMSISDVQIANFLRSLSHHSPRSSRYYLIEHAYPNDLIRKSQSNAVKIYANQSEVQADTMRQISQSKWLLRAPRTQLKNFALSNPNRYFSLINAQYGQTVLAHSYNTNTTRLRDILELCVQQVSDATIHHSSQSLENLNHESAGNKDTQVMSFFSTHNRLAMKSKNLATALQVPTALKHQSLSASFSSNQLLQSPFNLHELIDLPSIPKSTISSGALNASPLKRDNQYDQDIHGSVKSPEIIVLSEGSKNILGQIRTLVRQGTSFAINITKLHSKFEHLVEHYNELLFNFKNYNEVKESFSLVSQIAFGVNKDTTLYLYLHCDLKALYEQVNNEAAYSKPEFLLRCATRRSFDFIDYDLSQEFLDIKADLDYIKQEHLSFSEIDNKRLERNIKSMALKLFVTGNPALSIMLSNCKLESTEALHMHHLLEAQESLFELLTLDEFNVEQELLNPVSFSLHPKHKYLLRGKEMVLLLAATLHHMTQSALYHQSEQPRLHTSKDYLQSLNALDYLHQLHAIMAKCRYNELIYEPLTLPQRSLLEFLHIPVPNQESLHQIKSPNQVNIQ